MHTKILQKNFLLPLSIFLLIFFHVCPVDAEWTIITADGGDVGWYTSIALDNDNPRISYHEGTNKDLQYTWCDADCSDTTNWNSVVVDSAGDVGRHSSLYDSSGNVHISYYDESTVDDGDLKYATCSSGCDNPANWTTETVDSTDDVGLDTSLALDGLGNPHISYFDVDNLNLKYAYKSGGGWTIVVVDSLGTVGEFTSLALDGGNPRISYQGNDTLKYAFCDTGCDVDGNWTRVTVDNSAANVGEYTSLALTSTGNPCISYHDATNGDLKYATCNAGCDNPANWTIETVDSTGNTGWDTSLALGSGEIPHIAYYRFDLGNLLYAKLVGSIWETETVDSAGDVGEFCSLALDSNNDPHISYYDFDNEDLKYALLAEPCLVDADCNDNNDCTDDTCNTDTGNCIFTPNSDPCDDGLFCTETDQCSGGTCVGSVDPCVDDGQFCNGTEGCDEVGDQCVSSGDPCTPQPCDEETDTCVDDTDTDEDGIPDLTDNCLDTPNGPNQGTCTSGSIGTACLVDGECGSGGFCSINQEDTFPPQGNGIGDACDCEADFNCDINVDAADVDAFLTHFGRSRFNNPCTNDVPCNGDFNCDVNVDALDVDKFLEDFGRSQFFNPCPACIEGNWCVY